MVNFKGNSIKAGEPCQNEDSIVIEGFENYRVLPNNGIRTGDKVLCTIIPFEELPEDYQLTQQADDLELLLLESHYVLDIKNKEFTDNELISASSAFLSRSRNRFLYLFLRLNTKQLLIIHTLNFFNYLRIIPQSWFPQNPL